MLRVMHNPVLRVAMTRRRIKYVAHDVFNPLRHSEPKSTGDIDAAHSRKKIKRRSGSLQFLHTLDAEKRGDQTHRRDYRKVRCQWTFPFSTGVISLAWVFLVFPNTRCRLKTLKMERIKDYLLLEEEFVQNQEILKPAEERDQEERTRVDDLRGSPMAVGTLEEIIDDDHVIVSSSVGPEYYVSVMSFVDKDQLEPGCSVLLHHKTMAVVGVLQDDTDPMVSVMKLEKAPTESYADIGGLEQQIQEIKVFLATQLYETGKSHDSEINRKPWSCH